MKFLGIDYGEKRIGLAVSDAMGILARELVIYSPKEFDKKIGQLIKDEEIEKIVVGLPLALSGNETIQTKTTQSFVEKLKSLVDVPIVMFDERLSSQMLNNLPGGQKDKDSLAAQIILQNYLDSQKK